VECGNEQKKRRNHEQVSERGYITHHPPLRAASPHDEWQQM
jgi:hypothetical protein